MKRVNLVYAAVLTVLRVTERNLFMTVVSSPLRRSVFVVYDST